MSIYAIGDVRGQLQTLMQLLENIRFEPSADQLCFTGNLVNGGSESLAVLHFVQQLGKQAVTVLGEQELRLLAIAEDVQNKQADDKFDEILAAEDREAVLNWLARRPFLHHQDGFTVVHAGIPPEWSLSQARTFAIEAESSLCMGNRKTFLENIHGDDPTRWHAKHRGWKRTRFIVNALTRMHYFNAKGRLDSSAEAATTADHCPWYQMPQRAMAQHNIVFGHSQVAETTRLPNLFPLDSGCGRGGALSALQLSATPQWFSVPSI